MPSNGPAPTDRPKPEPTLPPPPSHRPTPPGWQPIDPEGHILGQAREARDEGRREVFGEKGKPCPYQCGAVFIDDDAYSEHVMAEAKRRLERDLESLVEEPERRKMQLGLTEVCPTCGATKEITLTWRDVFDCTSWKGVMINRAAESVARVGYRYFCYNDSIYRVDASGNYEDTHLTAKDVR